jgi:hypothetical protein
MTGEASEQRCLACYAWDNSSLTSRTFGAWKRGVERLQLCARPGSASCVLKLQPEDVPDDDLGYRSLS